NSLRWPLGHEVKRRSRDHKTSSQSPQTAGSFSVVVQPLFVQFKHEKYIFQHNDSIVKGDLNEGSLGMFPALSEGVGKNLPSRENQTRQMPKLATKPLSMSP
ncbi:hypothetical protein XELAEV_18020512mg, partial [Xenopus laevis]